ncbi:hypothetical protein [Desulforamulus aquiferis]|uniref:Uncharacterized protein n=1 Tax=Desulforamulus aquiferis TaxID=1397668 RepID=A0AAW7Z8X2_9FIRM|nr:hypothetical protein [Desulforamulus aquiferis]MDO7786005.1 hypothetical protein [Desulforamulus aquiferis]RYD04709.1 hypothetical protein N752_12320 [Desulforamulus aquiferis]
MKIGNLEKPTYNHIREIFISLIEELSGSRPITEDLWSSISDEETREKIIKEFVRRMEQAYSFEIVLKESLKDREGSVESVAGELYHVFSTMFLVEAINSKLRAGQGNIEI